MSKMKCVRMDDRDNVAIMLRDVDAGEEFSPGVAARTAIPQAHKGALTDIPKGGAVVRYGVVLGYALEDTPAGTWINERSLALPPSPDLDSMPFAVNRRSDLPKPPRETFMGFESGGDYAGTRNILAIHTTVQCVTGVVNAAALRIRSELLPKYPHVDGVVAINHAYGCGVAIDAPEAKVPIRALRNLVFHPNFGGEVMCVALGCEKLRPEMLLPRECLNAQCLITLQEISGFENMMSALLNMAEEKLKRLNERRRVEMPLSRLLVGIDFRLYCPLWSARRTS